MDWEAKYHAAHEEILERQRALQDALDKLWRMEHARYRCPRCRESIAVGERCSEGKDSGMRCMDTAGHDGFHWADVGRQKSVFIWHGPYHGYSCPGRLSNSEWCKRDPGHEGAHNNGRGTSWSEVEEDPYPARAREESSVPPTA